jgi:TolB protein
MKCRKSIFASVAVAAVALAGVVRGDEPAVTRIAKIGDFVQHLSWSPDGKKFLFTRTHKGKMGLWTMNADGGELKPLFAKEANPTLDGHWSHDSKKIVFIYDRLQGTDGKFQIDIVNADGTEQKNVIPHKGPFEEAPRLSPDGKSLAWASTRDKNQEIFLAAADGKNPKRLTTGFPSNSPSWSPDGKHIAFTSGRTGNLDIFVMKADGSDVRQLTKNPTMDYWPAWSPDGKRIAFTSNRDGNYEIYLMDADGGKQRNLTRHAGWDNFAAWSPDSKRIAFVSNRGGGYDIYVMDVDK